MKTDPKHFGGQMPLGLLTVGEKAQVLEVGKGHCHGFCHRGSHGLGHGAHLSRMEDMGLRPGKEVEMLSNGAIGPMLVRVDETRIAIGRGMAMRIIVRRRD